MNMSVLINKLLLALAKEGLLYKLNSFQKYIEDQKKFITGYKLLSQVEVKNKKTGEPEKKFVEILSTYKKHEILECLAEDYQNLQNEKKKQEGEEYKKFNY